MPGPFPIRRSISRSKSFTILADDKPIAALEATGTKARELLKELWFLQELSELKVGGELIYKTGTRLRARPATEEEWTIYDQECRKTENPAEIMFVYLVDLD